MTNKTQKCYEDAFTYVHQYVMNLDCASFTTDYEVAMRNALRVLFPNALQFACLFHFNQAVKKNAYKSNALVELIRSNEQARSVYYRLQCLPLLPAEYIPDMFDALKVEAYKIDRPTFRPLLKYYHRQWLVRVSKNTYVTHMTLYLSYICNSKPYEPFGYRKERTKLV